MPQGQVPLLRVHNRNGKAVKGRQIIVEVSGRESP
jgi:hypothetical protein